MRVELRDQLLDAPPVERHAVPSRQLRLDVGDLVGAVEAREDLDQLDRQHHDRRGVAGGVTQGHEATPLPLHGKDLDLAEARPGLSHV